MAHRIQPGGGADANPAVDPPADGNVEGTAEAFVRLLRTLPEWRNRIDAGTVQYIPEELLETTLPIINNFFEGRRRNVDPNLPISERFKCHLDGMSSDEVIIEELRDFVKKGGDAEEIYRVPPNQRHPLILSLLRGRVALAETLITEFKCNPSSIGDDRIGALLAIILSNHEFDKADALSRLILLGTPLDQTTRNGKTPFLHLLSTLNPDYEQLVDPFLKPGRKAHLDIVDAEGRSALHHAVISSSNALFARLIALDEVKALLERKNEKGFTPLQEAIRYCQVEKLSLLIAAQADITVLGPNGETLLDLTEQFVYPDVHPDLKNQIVTIVTQLMQKQESMETK